MKRMNRARRNVALSIITLGTVFATGTSAFAADPVASVDAVSYTHLTLPTTPYV